MVDPIAWGWAVSRAIYADGQNFDRHEYYGPQNTFEDKIWKEYIGFRGEQEFARKYDLPWRPKHDRRGDGGIDFRTPTGTIDVKTSSHNDELRVYCRTLQHTGVLADIYVRAHWRKWDDGVQFRGWQTGSIVRLYETRGEGKDKYHRVPMDLLNKMLTLRIR